MEIVNFLSDFWQQKHILIDSRKLIDTKDTLYFAIKGERHNGHDFILDLYQKGVRHFVVEQHLPSEIQLLPDIQIQQVEHTVSTLQKLVSLHRKKYQLPVIGITGSNGKTIVKEWLSLQLEGDKNVVKSPKSYNSQVGVPLSVWEINHYHEIGIFEAGISTVGEMQKLQQVIKPTIGLITNIGTAHEDGFKNQQEKLWEKLQLFQGCEVLIYRKEHELIDRAVQGLPCEKFTWGEASSTTLRYELLDTKPTYHAINLYFNHKRIKLQIPFIGRASFENCMHCVASLVYLGYPLAQLQKKINMLKRVNMRLEFKQGIHNCALVDDTYNNDLAGLSVALDFLCQQGDSNKRTVIISDMLGIKAEFASEVYQEVAELLESKQVTRLIGVGKELLKHQQVFQSCESIFFQDTNSLLKAIKEKYIYFQDEAILIKGARAFAFENIVTHLQQKIHGTRLEVNLDAIAHNLNVYRSLLKPTTKIMVMVKALAYGSGSYEVARLLQYHLVDYLGVAYPDEGIQLRENGIRTPIMVMNPQPESFSKVLAYDLEPEIYSFTLLEALIQQIKIQTPAVSKVKVHLCVDTGMHRLGFERQDIELLVNTLLSHPEIEVVSVFSHLAAADDEEHREFTAQQMAYFDGFVTYLSEHLPRPFIRHLLNSPGITRYPDAQMDMVRLGIGLYGIDVNDFQQEKLQVTSTLKTTISQIKTIPKGESIGYGRVGKAQQETKIATLAIGYADGFDRGFSNQNCSVKIRGELAPIIGNVCMDMCMADITHIENVQEGDEVVIFGDSPDIATLAKAIDTIPYEILTNVNERVKRIYYSE